MYKKPQSTLAFGLPTYLTVAGWDKQTFRSQAFRNLACIFAKKKASPALPRYKLRTRAGTAVHHKLSAISTTLEFR
jgi:hypothetical protein